ncbi:hypothetical protein [Pseudomonas solani]|uniref:hypothetical protein n=1 Tax=Pseudomonas solani TaxID=2731552 RepID=UPI00223658AE|nr:hypothetical protein [Pseudomonas solani]
MESAKPCTAHVGLYPTYSNAAAQGWQASPARALLDQLWSMGLLSWTEVGEGAYCNAPVAACYLHPQAPRYCGDALLFRLRTLRALGAQLEGRLAGEVPAGPPPGGWADAARVLPYYLGLRMQGRYLPLSGELVTVLEAVGFEVIEQLPAVTFPLAPVAVQIARRR